MAAINEEKTAAASYVLNFYRDIQTLTHHYANYVNLLTELQSKYAQAGQETPEEKDLVKNYSQYLRHYVIKTYIAYASIMTGLKKELKPDDKIKALNLKIRDNFIVQRQEVEEYVIEINSILMNSVIKDLLVNTQDLVNEIVGDNSG